MPARNARRTLARALIALWCSASLACGTLSVQEEKKLGQQVQRQVQTELQLLRDPLIVNYVREIGGEMASGARQSVFDFRFYVVEDESINAFAIPGGAIYVHTGLVQAAKTRGEIAGVLAHEIGHVTARHVARSYRRNRNTGLAANVLAMAIAILTGSGIAAQGGQMATGMAAQAYMNSYTQAAEREADALAVETMINARYDPNALITMFQTLQAEAAGGIAMPQFLMSHPATHERIREVQQMIQARAPLPAALRDQDQALVIIQKRIELVIGTDRADGAEPRR